MRRGRLKFDIYVAVDWSAQSKPCQGSDSIWIASSDGLCVNPPTRREAFQWLLQHLCEWCALGARVLIGWDFPFGLPSGGCALVLGRRGASSADLWAYLNQQVQDDEKNANNRFWVAQRLNRMAGGGGPFWGWQGKASLRGVPRKKPCFPFQGVSEYRECDLEIRRLHRWVSSPFQMAGAGAVGSQMIMGLPYVHRLRQVPALQCVSILYPFELTELAKVIHKGGAIIVHSEAFLPVASSTRNLAPRDRDQVLSFVLKAEQSGKSAELHEIFYQILELPNATQKKVFREEGWPLVLEPSL